MTHAKQGRREETKALMDDELLAPYLPPSLTSEYLWPVLFPSPPLPVPSHSLACFMCPIFQDILSLTFKPKGSPRMASPPHLLSVYTREVMGPIALFLAAQMSFSAAEWATVVTSKQEDGLHGIQHLLPHTSGL